MRKYSGGLDSVLSILKVGELSKPLRVGQQFAIVQLVEWLPSELSKEAEDLLLEHELKLWIKGMADYLDGELNSKLT